MVFLMGLKKAYTVPLWMGCCPFAAFVSDCTNPEVRAKANELKLRTIGCH
jgi:hypothetical protein